MDSPRQVKEPSKQMSPMVWLAITAGVLIVGFFAGMQYLKSTNSQDGKSTATTESGELQTTGGSPRQMGGGMGGSGKTCANGKPKSMMMLSGQRIETCGMPDSGTVTAIGENSATISASSGEAKTFTITAETQILTKNGTGSPSDIVTGDALLIVASEADETQARYIVVNPPEPGTTW